ncbi:MAG: glycosyltransferase [Muribaculaceae bacterium]|nr:glycosyltransferase [Muribaculaceae bacterium]
MAFSVLLSLYYKENPEYLRQSLDSVFSQTLRPDEVILVEDGPLTPELNAVLDESEKKYPELYRVKLPENGGLGKALNEGLKYCSYDLVIRTDTDDICFPDRFEKQVSFMDNHPDISASSGWIVEFEGNTDNRISIKKVPEDNDEIIKYGSYRNPMNHPATIFRKKDVEEVGGYKHFPLFEDWFLWARLMAKGYKLCNLQSPLLYFRTSPDMYKRRGGIKYAYDSFRFQLMLHKLGLITYLHAFKAGILRGTVYIMPNFIRKSIYQNILRR